MSPFLWTPLSRPLATRLALVVGGWEPAARAAPRTPHPLVHERRAGPPGRCKGLEDWVDHDPDDRSAIVELSGQELVPVAEIDGQVVVDSTRIIERLEELVPEPRLYPVHPCQNAGAKVFVEWFNEVWKRPPNALVEAGPELSARLAGWLQTFEDFLAEPDYLLGPEFTVADVVAFLFLKYGLGSEPGTTTRSIAS